MGEIFVGINLKYDTTSRPRPTRTPRIERRGLQFSTLVQTGNVSNVVNVGKVLKESIVPIERLLN